MKALTVKQPWASWIANGDKPLETRTWSTTYRGPLAIHAGLAFDHDAMKCVPPEGVPRGVFLAVVDLVDCRPMTPADASHALCPYVDGKYVFVLRNVRRLGLPSIKAKGKLGLWDTSALDGVML